MPFLLSLIHSAGDSDNVIGTLRQIIATQNKTFKLGILICGLTANNKVSTQLTADEKARITIYHLDEILSTSPVANKKTQLSEIEIADTLKHFRQLEILPDGLFVGRPSDKDCIIPYQLGTAFHTHAKSLLPEEYKEAKNIPTLFEEDNYQFFQSDHRFYSEGCHRSIPDTEIFFPLVAARDAFLKLNSAHKKELLHVTGLVVIDKLRAKAATWTLSEHTAIRHKLKIDQHQKLVFIAASKSVKEDQDMIEAIISAAPNYKNLQIRMGLHPGRDKDYESTVTKMLAPCSDQMGMLPGDLTSDDCALAADATLSVSSTVCASALSAATKSTTVVGYFGSEDKFYITHQVPERAKIYSKETLGLFFKKIDTRMDESKQDSEAKSSGKLIAKADLGLPEQDADVSMAKIITSKLNF